MLVGAQLLAPAFYANAVSLSPTNTQYDLEVLVDNAINTAAGGGAFTASVTISSYSNALVQLMIQRLISLGYGATTTSTTLTMTWTTVS